MDDSTAPLAQSSSTSGGAVEPAGRKAADATRIRAPAIEASDHFELRDPFAEVTYTARTMGEMVTKAEQLGAHRFVAIEANGQRAFVEQSNGEWQRRPMVIEDREVPRDLSTEKQGAHSAAPSKPVDGSTKANTRPAPSTHARTTSAAERAARVALLESALQERYIIKRAPLSVGDLTVGKTEYRFRGDSSRVAFTESTFKLATDTNSPSVARSMVDVSQARNWSALRVSGHEDFKRLVWLEASVRGVKAIGYEPNPADLEVLRREREARQVNRIEPASQPTAPAAAEKSSGRGGGRKAVLAAIDAVLVAKGIAAQKRQDILAVATEKLAQRERLGRAPMVKLYDRAAPTQRTVATPVRELEQSRGERAR